jgi:hypothetical protein
MWSAPGTRANQKPVDILVLPKPLDQYDLSGLVYQGGSWKGTIKDKSSPDTLSLTLDRFAGIVFGDGQTIDGGMPGFEQHLTDQVTLDLDALLTQGDAGDAMSDVEVRGLGDAKVVSIEHNGKTLVEGTDYSLHDGVLTLHNPNGVSLADVKITLDVPHGSPALDLTADVSASGKYGSDNASDDLTVAVPAVVVPEVPEVPGDPDPVVNAPEVQLEITAHNVAKDPLEGTTAVNGGAKDPSGNGFNWMLPATWWPWASTCGCGVRIPPEGSMARARIRSTTLTPTAMARTTSSFTRTVCSARPSTAKT